MRKIGIFCAILGAALAAVLGLIRNTDWFASESAMMMSEPVEFVVSFFWASVALAAVGLILIVRSTYIREEEVTFEDYLPQEEPTETVELVWICPRCGNENPDEALFCTECGFQDGTDPSLPPQDLRNWQCPVCGCVWSDAASVCNNCGFRRFGKTEPAR